MATTEFNFCQFLQLHDMFFFVQVLMFFCQYFYLFIYIFKITEVNPLSVEMYPKKFEFLYKIYIKRKEKDGACNEMMCVTFFFQSGNSWRRQGWFLHNFNNKNNIDLFMFEQPTTK